MQFNMFMFVISCLIIQAITKIDALKDSYFDSNRAPTGLRTLLGKKDSCNIGCTFEVLADPADDILLQEAVFFDESEEEVMVPEVNLRGLVIMWYEDGVIYDGLKYIEYEGVDYFIFADTLHECYDDRPRSRTEPATSWWIELENTVTCSDREVVNSDSKKKIYFASQDSCSRAKTDIDYIVKAAEILRDAATDNQLLDALKLSICEFNKANTWRDTVFAPKCGDFLIAEGFKNVDRKWNSGAVQEGDGCNFMCDFDLRYDSTIPSSYVPLITESCMTCNPKDIFDVRFINTIPVWNGVTTIYLQTGFSAIIIRLNNVVDSISIVTKETEFDSLKEAVKNQKKASEASEEVVINVAENARSKIKKTKLCFEKDVAQPQTKDVVLYFKTKPARMKFESEVEIARTNAQSLHKNVGKMAENVLDKMCSKLIQAFVRKPSQMLPLRLSLSGCCPVKEEGEVGYYCGFSSLINVERNYGARFEKKL